MTSATSQQSAQSLLSLLSKTSASSLTSESSPESQQSQQSVTSGSSPTSVSSPTSPSPSSQSSGSSPTSLTSARPFCVTSCTGLPSGDFANCNNCSSYFRCDGVTAGQLKECSPTLSFNPDTAQCDLQANVICATTSATSMSSPDSPQSQTSRPSQQSVTSGSTMTSRSSPTVFCLTSCGSIWAGRFPDCNDCTKYWSCPGDGNPGTNPACAATLQFNPDTLQCDVMANVVCSQARAFGGGSVMVWGGITAAGKTPLVTVHGNLTARRYIDEILRPHVVPAIHNQGLTFMQDNALAHRARITNQFLHENNIPVPDPWPPYSPDLNPIEHLWDLLDRRVRMRQPQPQTLLQLERALHEEWDNIPQQAVQRLIGSMRRRCQVVILSKGHHTRY
ncbi:transposable element Tcb2 transposase [Elysia marginata]|uniref:Transposable element Tcb2 transposase n=1 Tax=Elysia marginata TaxID=1093978 RepID=A0AAV4G501_9GAST|nr:transposable element Tcb2 transposase [Elysia marginata]